MPTLDKLKATAPFVLIKGEPGTRKSTQALGFPGPQRWFSWDRKMSGIQVPAQLWGIDPSTITYEDYDNWNKAKDDLEKLIFNCPFSTLVFDSLTSMVDMTLRQTRKSKGAGKGKVIGGIQVDDIEDFNAESSAVNELIALAKDINVMHNVNIVIIAHVMEVVNRGLDNKTTITRSIVTAGKRVAAKIPAYCTEVWHFNKKPSMVIGESSGFVCVTETNGDDFARTSVGLPAAFDFTDKPIYKTHYLPAVEKLKG